MESVMGSNGVNDTQPVIYTIGHSSRSIGEFLGLLRENGITLVVDVRRYPSSRKFPHFNRPELERILSENGIKYLWRGEVMGGRLGRPSPDSPNLGLRSPGFRAYADRMLTDEFQAALREILSLAERERVALMCAEALYFRCHRFLISDALTSLGAEVIHILGPGQIRRHKLTKIARIIEPGRVIYPAPEEDRGSC